MSGYRQPFRNEWPITQKYGEKITSSFHTGIDFGCPMNTEIMASADGTVMFAGWDPTGFGNAVIINHLPNLATLYGHLEKIYVHKGRTVKQGDVIGLSGTTGNSTGPHLHFEARTKWNDYRSHFDPFSLPLKSFDDTIIEDPSKWDTEGLFGADKLKPGEVVVAAPSGVFAHNTNFTNKVVLPYGMRIVYSGESKEKNGLEFCKCELWIAVNDGETQLLNNIK